MAKSLARKTADIVSGNFSIPAGSLANATVGAGDIGATELADGAITAAKLASGVGIAAGTIAYFSMSAAPTGWLKANGSVISRTSYSDLFSAIGETYGSGDGSTTFKIPDLRGEFLRTWDDSKGTDSGRVFASSQGSQNKYEYNPLFFNGHTGGGDMVSSNFGLGSGHAPVQVDGTGYPDNYGGYTKPIFYLSSVTFTEDNDVGSTNTYGKGYNSLRVPVGVSGSTDNGTLTQNSEARVTNVALLACIKY
jgi:phage-related tail fiber protein